jgi:putative phage-type endonuclease
MSEDSAIYSTQGSEPGHEQGSPDWYAARLGKVTASRFADVMTNGRGTGSMGQTAYSYMYDIIAEILTGQVQDKVDVKAMQWGHQTEPHARAMYCFHRNARVIKTGFLVHHDPAFSYCGGSPDGLVEGDEEGPGGVEIKCPLSSRIHLGYLEEGQVPGAYQWQVDGLLWVTGRKWWDFVSFDPRMPEGLQMFCVRQYRNEDACSDLEDRAKRFWEQLQIKLGKIKSREVALNAN